MAADDAAFLMTMSRVACSWTALAAAAAFAAADMPALVFPSHGDVDLHRECKLEPSALITAHMSGRTGAAALAMGSGVALAAALLCPAAFAASVRNAARILSNCGGGAASRFFSPSPIVGLNTATRPRRDGP